MRLKTSTIASRAGESFVKAEKGMISGGGRLNTLFKYDMLFIYEDGELAKLGGELATLLKKTAKNKAKDDFADAFRYAVTLVPWDFTFLNGEPVELAPEDVPEKPLNRRETEIAERRRAFEGENDEEANRLEDEFNEWNTAYGN
jgi:hypothetical protein